MQWNQRLSPFLFYIFLLIPVVLDAQDYLQLESTVVKYKLPNGLRVLLLERHHAPVVSLVTYANVGSVDEMKGVTGLAHLFVHMAFKGTRTIGTKDIEAEINAMAKEDETFGAWLAEYRKGPLSDPVKLKELNDAHRRAIEDARQFVQSNEMVEAIRQAGGEGLNAGTSHDATFYYYTLPSNKLELWMSLESDRFLNPVLREFYTEKKVIIEERRRRIENQPTGKLFEEFITSAYKTHPYGVPVVGRMSDLMTMTRTDAEHFFRTNYTPQNLVIAIVGDFNTAQVIGLVDMYWGRITAGADPETVHTVEPPPLGQKRIEVKDKMQPMLLLGYCRPDARHKDATVLDAMTDILGTGRTSRFYKSLVKEKKIADSTQAISGITEGKYPGLVIFRAIPAKDHTVEECEQAMYEQIDRLKDELLEPDELVAVKTRAKVNFLRRIESNRGLAFQLALAETLHGDYREMFRQVEKIEAITPKDIQRVAKEYFTIRNRTVAMIVAPEE